MATKLGLYQAAARLVKQRKLDTLTDDEWQRYELDGEYDATIAYMLEMGLWNFAMRTVSIDEDVSVDPAFGYNYAFEKPSDWVRTSIVSANPRLFPRMGANEYLDEGDYWSANVTPMYVSYVSNGASYGLDLTRWPALFTRAVEFELAYRIAPTVTSMTDKDSERLELRKHRALKNAASKDAMNQAPSQRQPGRLVMSRMGGARIQSESDT